MKLISILITVFLCPAVSAQIDLSTVHGTYDSERLKSDWGYQIRAGQSMYVWGSYETPALQLVGQNLNSLKLWGIGIGYRHVWDRIQVFGEFGYFDPSISPDDNIRDEAVWRQLRNDHGETDWHPTHTVYDLQHGYGGRLGISYEIAKHLIVSVAYRFLSLNESLDACGGSDPTCAYPVESGNGHWQNRQTLKLGTIEAGIGIRF